MNADGAKKVSGWYSEKCLKMSDELLKATGSCRNRALVESRLDITAGNTGDTSANFYWKEKVGKFFRKVRSKVCKCIEMNRLIENFNEKKEDFG